MKTFGIRKSAVALAIAVVPWTAEYTMADDTEVLAKGKEVYSELCTPCHGFDGVKVMEEAPSFSKGEALEKVDTELMESITNGKGDIMPPWAEELSLEEIVAVLTYVKTLGVEE